jgi:hypothetical protein
MSTETNFDRRENSLVFFSLCFVSVTAGLLVGGVLDSIVRKVQRDTDDWRDRQVGRAAAFFGLQVVLNILLLLVLTKTNDQFVRWLQLSVAGALFAVLLFAAQRNLANNVLRLTNF